MQTHLDALRQMCRLCGSSNLNKPRQKTVHFYQSAIFSLFKMNINEDEEHIHPKAICRGCELLLERKKKWSEGDKNTPFKFTRKVWERYVYIEHTHDCLLCQGKPIKFPVPISTKFVFGTEDKFCDYTDGFLNEYKNACIADKEIFIGKFIENMTDEELSIVAENLAVTQRHAVWQDCETLSTKYKDLGYLNNLYLPSWLLDRNPVIYTFVRVLSFGTSHLEGDLQITQLTGMALIIELMYRLRSKRVVFPFSFLQKLYIYNKTNSKVVADVLSGVHPGGCYFNLKNWLNNLNSSNEPVAVPKCDVVNVFDNEQVIRYRRTIDPGATSKTSVVTSCAFVQFDSKLQQDPTLVQSFVHNLEEYDNYITMARTEKAKETLKLMRRTFEDGIKGIIDQKTEVHEKLRTVHNNMWENSIVEKLNIVMKEKGLAIDTDFDKEQVRYGHVETGHLGKKEVTLMEPALYANPNSYENVAKVLREIGKRNGVSIYGGNDRAWTFVCCDGLPFNIVRKLISDGLLCIHCKGFYIGMNELCLHHHEIHPGKELSFLHEFSWVFPIIGNGHYEHTLLRSFFDINWIPFLECVAEEIGYKSNKSKAYIKSANNHHMSWQILLLLFDGFLLELMNMYINSCSDHTELSSINFRIFCENIKSQRIKYVLVMLSHAQAIINFRIAVRRNNGELLSSSKLMAQPLLFARNHPRYQQIAISEDLLLLQAPTSVQEFLRSNVSATVSGDASRGQGYDYLLEEKNRQIKRFISSSVTPDEKMWRTVCLNNDRLNELHLKCEEFFGCSDDGIGAVKDPYTTNALTAVRQLAREYLCSQNQEFVAMGKRVNLHNDLLRLDHIGSENRQNLVQSTCLKKETAKPVLQIAFVTPNEESMFHKKSVPNLKRQIKVMLESMGNDVLDNEEIQLKSKQTKEELTELYNKIKASS